MEVGTEVLQENSIMNRQTNPWEEENFSTTSKFRRISWKKNLTKRVQKNLKGNLKENQDPVPKIGTVNPHK